MSNETPTITIRPEFTVHKLNEQGMASAADLAKLFSVFLTNIECHTGTEGRYMAIVRTKLEEASFFAKKALAVMAENQDGFVTEATSP